MAMRRRLSEHGKASRDSKHGVFSGILCPIDFGEGSLAGFELAARLAAHNGATVYMLHVVPPSAARWSESGDRETVNLGTGRLRQLAERIGPELRYQCFVAIGEPADEII